MDFQTWRDEQDEIYEKFRKKQELVKTNGIMPWTNKTRMGFYVEFKQPKNISRVLGNLSLEITRTAPSVYYDSQLLHTTISDYQITDEEKFTPDFSVLAKFSDAIESVKKTLKQPKVHLGKISYNETTTIVEGQPDINFYDCCMKIKDACKKQGIELREPWGAHSTIGRFYEQKTPEELDRFFDLMDKSSKIDKQIILPRIEVGTFMMSPRAITQFSVLEYKI
ncbi:hypothetical protein GOV12_05855 [Candidatus Pacearchaeota archaeon]|nr:hypothetical protein [Candidatus Pacearchaeota archaeon]